MSEQQAAEVLEAPEVEQHLEEQTTDQDVSPTASDSGESHEEKVEFNEAQQKILNQKAFDVRGVKREKEELERTLEDLRSKMPVEQAPEVPAAPDPYSDTYEQDLLARDQAIKERGVFDDRIAQKQQQTQWLEQEDQREQNEALNQSVSDYTD